MQHANYSENNRQLIGGQKRKKRDQIPYNSKHHGKPQRT